LKKKFLKYQKILKEKDSQINSLQQTTLESQYFGNFKRNNFIFDLNSNQKNFFTNWIIVDSIDSINGPSNWSLKKTSNNKNDNSNNLSKKSKIILLQSSQIISNENSKQSTSILFRNKILQENIYFKLAFISKVSGEIFVNFKYVDYENYLQLRLSRVSEIKGKISLILNKSGSSRIIADLDCEKMVSFLKKCSGFEIFEFNKIEVFSFKEKYFVLFNDMIIFTASLQDIVKENNNNNKRNSKGIVSNNENKIIYNYNIINNENSSEKKINWTASRILIGINNQKNFEVHELQIKNLDLDDARKFQSEFANVKHYADRKNYQNLNESAEK
jgi:hypothetical protein